MCATIVLNFSIIATYVKFKDTFSNFIGVELCKNKSVLPSIICSVIPHTGFANTGSPHACALKLYSGKCLLLPSGDNNLHNYIFR